MKLSGLKHPRTLLLLSLAFLVAAGQHVARGDSSSTGIASSATTYVTIKVALTPSDADQIQAVQLANDEIWLDPSVLPRKVARGVFEFKLSGSELSTAAIAELREVGLLVNPMVEYPGGGFIKYTDRVSVTFDLGLSITDRDRIHAALGCRVVGQERSKSNRETVEIVTPDGWH